MPRIFKSIEKLHFLIKENNLGKPVVMNNVEPDPNDNYYTWIG